MKRMITCENTSHGRSNGFGMESGALMEKKEKEEGKRTMKCCDCPHFHIVAEPIRASGGGYWDLGMAECKKLDLCTNFLNHGKLKKLVCVEECNDGHPNKD